MPTGHDCPILSPDLPMTENHSNEINESPNTNPATGAPNTAGPGEAQGGPEPGQSQAASSQERGNGNSVPPATWDVGSHLRLWLVAAVALVIDLATKHWAFTRLDPHPDRGMVVIPHVMKFQQSLNPGALFGLGKGWTPVFIAASVLALAFVLFLFIHSTRDRRSLHVALGLVLAGALGNLYDRSNVIADVVQFTTNGRTATVVGTVVEETDKGVEVGDWPNGANARFIPADWEPVVRQQGVVRDFIKMEPQFQIAGKTIHIWPWVFNVADMALVFGVAILMLNFWWERKEERTQTEQTAEPATS